MKLKYDEISNIMKFNLNPGSTTKRIQDIFKNERYFNKINYKPYYQRNYIWNKDKASYFLESIFIGTEIPPIVMFDSGSQIEIIDGRQRYETIYKFISNEITLDPNTIKTIEKLKGKRYSDLDEGLKRQFDNSTLRILSYRVTNEPVLDELKEDLIKKEIFRRYNSGITSLSKAEMLRAKFIKDPFTIEFDEILSSNDTLLAAMGELFLSKVQMKKKKRDRINEINLRVRNTIGLLKLTVHEYASAGNRQDILDAYYFEYMTYEGADKVKRENLSKRIMDAVYIISKINEGITVLEEKERRMNAIPEIQLQNKRILSEGLLWIFLNCGEAGLDTYKSDCFIRGIIDYIFSSRGHFDVTGSHYYMRIKDRYKYLARYFIDYHGMSNLKPLLTGKNKRLNPNSDDKSWDKAIIKRSPMEMNIDDVTRRIKDERFLIRPVYQRSEAISIVKASSLIESIILGIRIPPLFIYKRPDGVSEVVDGQQRLLSIIGYLGREYRNQENKMECSDNFMFELKNLKILNEVEGMNSKQLKEYNEKFYDKILDFELDVIEIDHNLNNEFDQIDLFLRLNSKPTKINENSFEMWNSYGNKELIGKIKQVFNEPKYKWFFKNLKDKKMKNEELITSLAYLYYESKTSDREKDKALDIYIRYGKVTIRLPRKKRITKVFEECNLDKGVKEEFSKGVIEVEKFINKVQLLLSDSDLKGSFDNILNLSRKESRADRDYYLLWFMLSDIDDDHLLINRESIIPRMRDVFSKSRLISLDLESNDFVKYLQDEISMMKPQN